MALPAAFVGEPPVMERLRLPAFVVKQARLQASHVAREDFSARTGNHIEIGARLACPSFERAKQTVHAGALVDGLDLAHFGADGVARLLLEQALGHACHVEDEKDRAEGKENKIECGEPDCRRSEQDPEFAHVSVRSSLIM